MRIGLDWMGVVSDNSLLKSRLIRERHGLYFPSSQCRKEVVCAPGGLTEEQYQEIKKEILSPESIKRLTVRRSAWRNIYQLKREEDEITIVSTRNSGEEETVRKWLHLKGLDWMVNLVVVPKGESKAAACTDLDLEVFVENKERKALPLVGVVPNVYLLQYPGEQRPQAPIIPVYSWTKLYDKIQELKSSASRPQHHQFVP